MIGTLLHFNSGGSKAIAIVVDYFRYDRKDSKSRTIQFGDIIVALEWIKKDERIPSQIWPARSWNVDGHDHSSSVDLRYWPLDYEKKAWYNLKHFKIISEAPKKTT
jgi:hypothetical protein